MIKLTYFENKSVNMYVPDYSPAGPECVRIKQDFITLTYLGLYVDDVYFIIIAIKVHDYFERV